MPARHAATIPAISRAAHQPLGETRGCCCVRQWIAPRPQIRSPTSSERQWPKRYSISIAWWWPPEEPRLRIEHDLAFDFALANRAKVDSLVDASGLTGYVAGLAGTAFAAQTSSSGGATFGA